MKIKLVVFELYNLSTFKTNGLLYLQKSKNDFNKMYFKTFTDKQLTLSTKVSSKSIETLFSRDATASTRMQMN